MPGDMFRPDPPVWHTELRPQLLALAGLFALLGIGEPFARDAWKVLRRNVSFGSSGARRFGQSVSAYAGDLLTRSRVIALVAGLVLYAAFGAVLFALGVPKLTGIWTGVLAVAAGVLVSALFLLMLFEAEGPVWAIAKLSFKEAVRSQVLWVFLVMFLPFLFPLQWFYTGKPADELRTTTVAVTLVLSILILFPALLLTSFGIPNDIKNLNIFTVVSKPVERFEIVLGRFVGYVALMTLVLLALTGVSLVLVTNTSLSDKAREETYKARVPYRGKLEFKSLVGSERTEKKEFEGTNVGREFDYRKYIAGGRGVAAAGHLAVRRRAVGPRVGRWRPRAGRVHLRHLPADQGRAEQGRAGQVPVRHPERAAPPAEQERGRGVAVGGSADDLVYKSAVNRLATGVLSTTPSPPGSRAGPRPTRPSGAARRGQADEEPGRAAGGGRRRRHRGRGRAGAHGAGEHQGARPDSPVWKATNALAEEFGYFEIGGKEVFDYQVMGVEVPAGLFRNALKTAPPKDAAGKPLPRLSVFVKCESDGQLLGAAEPDLYLLRTRCRTRTTSSRAWSGCGAGCASWSGWRWRAART